MVNAATHRARFGWYHGWNIVAVCVLAGIASSALVVNGFSLFLNDWSVSLHVQISTLLLGMTAFSLGYALLSPFIGMITDRFPIRIILACGVAVTSLLCIGISYMTHIWEYLFLYGVAVPISASATTMIPANAVVTRWFVRRLGLALGITGMGMWMAGIFMPPLVAAVLPMIGWRMIWRAGGILIGVVVLPLVLLIVRERPSERDAQYYMTDDATPNASIHNGHNHNYTSAGSANAKLLWRDILVRRNFWLLAIGYLAMQSLNGAAGYNLVPIAASHGISQQSAGVLVSSWSFALMAATLGGGILSDRFGNRLPLAGLCFLTAAGGMAIAFAGGFPVLLAGALLVGVGGGYWPLLASSLAAEYGAAGFGRAFGALLVLMPLGASPSFALAKMREDTGSYTPALLILTALCVAGGIACLFLRDRRGAFPPVLPQSEAAKSSKISDADSFSRRAGAMPD